MPAVSHRRWAIGVAIAAAFTSAAAPSQAQQKTPAVREYVDEDYDFQVSSPQGWRRSNPASLSVPGEVCRAWSPDGTTTLSIFIQRAGTAVHPRTILDASAAAMAGIGAVVKEKEVRPVAGMRAMWLVVEGDGTGAALTGKGAVRTSQHWVAIPRARDVLVLLLNAPAADFATGEAAFNAMLATLRVGGTQTPEQRAAEPPPSPAAAADLDFEAPPGAHGLSPGWHQPGPQPPTGGEGYEVAADAQVAHSGKASGRIRFVAGQPQAFGTLTQAIAADAWRGKRLRLSGWLRTAGVTSGFAGLWLRVDGTAPPAFDNMSRRGVKGTTEWHAYSVVLDVADGATGIAFGALLAGDGTLWVDDLRLEPVGKDVPTT